MPPFTHLVSLREVLQLRLGGGEIGLGELPSPLRLGRLLRAGGAVRTGLRAGRDLTDIGEMVR